MTPHQEAEFDKALLTTILSNMMEGVVAVDTNGRILFINAAIARLFEIDAANANGKHLLEIVRQNQINVLLQSVLKDRKPRTDELRTFAPEERIFEAIAAPLIENGHHVGALLVLHDITKVRRLEQVRRDFVANVSHEMRTPLASIKGFAETLRTGAMDDENVAVEFLKSIERHTDNMTALVEDLLDLTAIESGHRAPIKEALHLEEIVPEVIKGISPVAHKQNIEVSTELTTAGSPVSMDRRHFKQILANLLENAIKFNQERGWVKIRSTQKDETIELTVNDSGSGIPAQDLPRIFERFYRVDKARSRAMGGTGLGLSIVKHLIEANGGTISVHSSVGKGSTFTITLPRA